MFIKIETLIEMARVRGFELTIEEAQAQLKYCNQELKRIAS